MYTNKNRDYTISMLKQALQTLEEHNHDGYELTALDYIHSAKGEINDSR